MAFLPCGPRANLEIRSMSPGMRSTLPSPPAGRLAGLQPAAQLGAAACGHRARGPALGELDAAGAGEVQELLALVGLARGAQEQPAQEDDREDRALDHHDRAGGALVGQRREAV